jgi:hypothetical protein
MSTYLHFNKQVNSSTDAKAGSESDEESVDSYDVDTEEEQELEDVDYESDFEDMV